MLSVVCLGRRENKNEMHQDSLGCRRLLDQNWRSMRQRRGYAKDYAALVELDDVAVKRRQR